MERFAIIIVSYDGYQDVWPSFFRIFETNWPDCPFKLYLVNNTLKPPFKNVIVINTGVEINWCDRVQKALEQIPASNIILLLEDYFFGEKVQNEKIYEILNFFEQNDCRYMRLINIPRSRNNKIGQMFNPILADEEYGVNLQPAVWKKDFLSDSVRSISGSRSAWDFEITLLRKAQMSFPFVIEGCYAINYNVLHIHNGILKGKWIPKELKYFADYGLPIETSVREKLTMPEYLKYVIRFNIREHISYESRKKIKALLKKLKFKFVSEI